VEFNILEFYRGRHTFVIDEIRMQNFQRDQDKTQTIDITRCPEDGIPCKGRVPDPDRRVSDVKADLDWTTRPWEPARAYGESKLHVVALSCALARRWPQVLSNAVDPGWARTEMGGPGAPVDLDTGQRTQTWLAVSDAPAALVSGCYWHHLRKEQPASEATDPECQDQLIAKLRELTGVALPQA
jgi:NAD(P)-dependent dehydrogenase (short-subunit alcohol dehydrogenase family)